MDPISLDPTTIDPTTIDPTAIDPTTTINALVDRHPSLMPILAGHGLDLCCGGPLTLAEAAERHGLDMAALIGEIERAMATGAPARR